MLLSWDHQKDSSKCNFSIAHWNLNSIAAQNFVKLSQLEAYNPLHSFDLICLSKTRLYNFHRFQWFVSEGLQLIHRVDDPDNVKGGACVYYKETLVVQFLQTKLDQCIVSEVIFKNKKKGHVISLYRSPSQLQINLIISFNYLRNFSKMFLNLKVQPCKLKSHR